MWTLLFVSVSFSAQGSIFEPGDDELHVSTGVSVETSLLPFLCAPRSRFLMPCILMCPATGVSYVCTALAVLCAPIVGGRGLRQTTDKDGYAYGVVAQSKLTDPSP